jgi:hypothetical protein
VKRRRRGRTVRLEDVLEPFARVEPPLNEHSSEAEWAAHRAWNWERYAAAEANGYSKIEVFQVDCAAKFGPPLATTRRSRV